MHQSLAVENLYLPVQGLVVGIFTHDHVGQYAGTRFCMCIAWGRKRGYQDTAVRCFVFGSDDLPYKDLHRADFQLLAFGAPQAALQVVELPTHLLYDLQIMFLFTQKGLVFGEQKGYFRLFVFGILFIL